MKTEIICCIAGLLLGITASSQDVRTLDVSNQEQFNGIPGWIREMSKAGADRINVRIGKGVYRYPHMFINLFRATIDADITISGEGATLIAEGSKASLGTALVDPETLADINPWKPYEQPGTLVEIVDKQSKLCRIRTREKARIESDCEGVYITIPQWYTSKSYPVREIRAGYVYFVADDLSKVPGGYSVNYDSIYGRSKPRYRICDTRAVSDSAYVCEATCFLSCDITAFRSLTVSGLTFVGNGDSAYQLFRLDNTETESIVIRDCRFCGIRSIVIGIGNTDNVTVTSNYFARNMSACVRAMNGTCNIRVTDNFFENTGLYRNVFCVDCRGEDYYIAGNRMKDFSYAAVAVGEWYMKEKKGPSCGVVRDNEIWYSPEYIADKENWTVMDSGAIYIYTQNDGAVIRNNYIHDYVGMKDNRGIFCDDGAYGFTITGNVIRNVPNSYSIDSRLCLKVETMAGSVVKKVNYNNIIRNNRVDGPVRFEKRP